MGEILSLSTQNRRQKGSRRRVTTGTYHVVNTKVIVTVVSTSYFNGSHRGLLLDYCDTSGSLLSDAFSASSHVHSVQRCCPRGVAVVECR